MQTDSRTYRKGHMSALPTAKPGAKAGQGEGERSQRNREDKRQASEHHHGRPRSTRPAPPQALPSTQATPVPPQGPGLCPSRRLLLGAPVFFWWGTKSGHPG